MKTLKIGNIKLKNPLFLAPMVDVTNLPYRLICRQSGCAIAYTEMLYIDAILHKNKKTQNMMKTSPEDKPIGLQITGNSAKEFKSLIPYAKKFNLIDINCGCPSIKITGNQAGSYLLRNPDKITKMIKALKTTEKPITVKIRLGFKKNNALEVAKSVEKAGADLLTVHARLAVHGKSVPADWKEIKKIKDSIGIPVIGNGDIFSGSDAAKMLDICDGAMIARGALGDPLIFKRILKYLRTGKEQEKDVKANLKLFQKYIILSEKYNLADIPIIKSIGAQFIKEIEGAAHKRAGLMKLKTLKEIKSYTTKLI